MIYPIGFNPNYKILNTLFILAEYSSDMSFHLTVIIVMFNIDYNKYNQYPDILDAEIIILFI